MEFEWDEEKAKENLAKHGVSFEEAMTVFEDPLHETVFDSFHSEFEVRELTIGYSNQNRLVIASHTNRGNKMRLISARLPSRTERETYERG